MKASKKIADWQSYQKSAKIDFYLDFLEYSCKIVYKYSKGVDG